MYNLRKFELFEGAEEIIIQIDGSPGPDNMFFLSADDEGVSRAREILDLRKDTERGDIKVYQVLTEAAWCGGVEKLQIDNAEILKKYELELILAMRWQNDIAEVFALHRERGVYDVVLHDTCVEGSGLQQWDEVNNLSQSHPSVVGGSTRLFIELDKGFEVDLKFDGDFERYA